MDIVLRVCKKYVPFLQNKRTMAQVFVTGLGGVVMLAAVIAAFADCQRASPRMG